MKDHPFFSSIDWDMISRQKVRSPIEDRIVERNPEHLDTFTIDINDAVSLDDMVPLNYIHQEITMKVNPEYLHPNNDSSSISRSNFANHIESSRSVS